MFKNSSMNMEDVDYIAVTYAAYLNLQFTSRTWSCKNFILYLINTINSNTSEKGDIFANVN